MAINLNGTTGITTTGLTSNGIDDNATSTAMTLDASGNVGIGTSSPTTFSGYNTVHHKNTSGDAIYLIESDGGIIGQTFVNDASGVVTTGSRSNHPWRVTTNEVEHMRIDTSGAVTMPSQPAFLATKSAKQSNVAVNSQVTVVFETEVFDQNNDFASSQFTAPVTGKYQLNLSLYTNELDSAADYYLAVIKTSNREYQNVIDPGVLASDPVYWNQGVSVLADMDANDTAYVFIQQGNGNQQADVATPTLFSGYLVA